VCDEDTRDGPVFSVVLPVFNEEKTLPELYRRLTAVMQTIDARYELVFIDDGSTDQSLALLRELAHQDRHVKLLALSRNFGHQLAITAGLDHSGGDAVILMDADLQDPPELLPRFIAKWQEGYEIVYGVREDRHGESRFKRSTAAVFYRLLRRLARVEIPVDAGDFRLMDRRAVNALNSLRERHRFVRGLTSWIGFRQAAVPFVRKERYAGTTKYPLLKMLRFALDGLTSFSFAPLQLATYLGFGASGISFCYALYAIGLKLFTNEWVTGWASLMVVMLFIGGVQLMTLGIIGEYIGRFYEEIKQRPLYVVAEAIGVAPEALSLSVTHDTYKTHDVHNARRQSGHAAHVQKLHAWGP
jgi:dolichol-phosphate mannosyltransferase